MTKRESKKGKKDPVLRKELKYKIRQKTEENEKASLDLFEKIEAEKNQRLQIDPESEEAKGDDSIDEKVETPSQYIDNRKSDDSLNKSRDNNSQDLIQEQKAINRQNVSIDKKDTEQNAPQSRVQLETRVIQNPNQYTHNDNEEEKSGQKEPIFKLLSIKPDQGKLDIELHILSENVSKQINFEFNLKKDTSEGIARELEQAFSITKDYKNKIKQDLDEIVASALEKIRKQTTQQQKPQADDRGSHKKVAEPQYESTEHHHHKPKSQEQHNEDVLEEQHKRIEKAQYAIGHFVKSVESEISSIARYQGELEILSSQSDNTETQLYLQLIKDVIDSYRNFKYNRSKLSQNSKSKSGKLNTKGVPPLKQNNSFKGMPSAQLGVTSGNLTKASSVFTQMAQNEPYNSSHSGYYPGSKDYDYDYDYSQQ